MNSEVSHLLNLKGKSAIVTGGAVGIGQAIIEYLALAGARVLCVDIAEASEIEDSRKKVSSLEGKIEYLQQDISAPGAAEKIVHAALEKFGDLHILVNNAGIFKYRAADEMTEDLWDRTMNINLKAMVFLCKAFVNHLKAQKHGGRIINISSVDSMKPTGNLSHYDSSKGGVNMFTKALAKEVGPLGITVNAIAPGGVQTPGTTQMFEEEMTEEQIAAMEEQTKQFIQALPLQRMGQPDEIAKIALFLASDASSYMTGSIVVADGGLLLV
ncbi:MAG TPA: SDR family NAD(P)-dependent oxidoreductase [Saprospiraceae bacterium]|nr:SDR family NAD(P)-dependent oxidoreductase [Saprospiraceae bacterium]